MTYFEEKSGLWQQFCYYEINLATEDTEDTEN